MLILQSLISDILWWGKEIRFEEWLVFVLLTNA